jgi:hypothetical protein
MSDLEQMREDVIGKIETAFPKETPTPVKLFDHASQWEYAWARENLDGMLNGKRWDEVISHPSVIYYMSDIDYVPTLTNEAYAYYLPALLVATTQDPTSLIYARTMFEQIWQIREKFSLQQVEALIVYSEFQAQIERQHNEPPAYPGALERAEEFEEMQLRLMLYLDELKSS